jgi:hypothetical protein
MLASIDGTLDRPKGRQLKRLQFANMLRAIQLETAHLANFGFSLISRCTNRAHAGFLERMDLSRSNPS